MLEQIIYTRCDPSIDLATGKDRLEGGFGVYGVSDGVIRSLGAADREILLARLRDTSASAGSGPCGTFTSYEYHVLPGGLQAVLSDSMVKNDTVPHAGVDSRVDTHVRQAYLGRLNGYPFEWIGGSVWTAARMERHQFYPRVQNPQASSVRLKTISEEPEGGVLSLKDAPDSSGKKCWQETLSRIRLFVQDGRAEAVKAGVWFLLHEYEKPASERRVLLVRDTPGNLMYWTAAIQLGFSAELAQQISYIGNLSNLNGRADNVLFYRMKENGEIDRSMNMNNPRRIPIAMIVGYDPADPRSSAVKQLEFSNYRIIDGVTKSALFAADETVHDAYYSALIRYDADIWDFCKYILPGFGIHNISSSIPQLYDAYAYLLSSKDSSGWRNYTEVTKHLRVILQGTKPESQYCSYLLDQLISVYGDCFLTDSKNGFELYSMMKKLEQLSGRLGGTTDCLVKILRESIGQDNDRWAFPAIWQALNSIPDPGVTEQICAQVSGEDSLYLLIQQGGSPQILAAQTKILMKALNGRPAYMTPVQEQFIAFALIRCVDSPLAFDDVLEALCRDRNLFGKTVRSAAERLNAAGDFERLEKLWKHLAQQNIMPFEGFVSFYCSCNGAEISLLEQILADQTANGNLKGTDAMKYLGQAQRSLPPQPGTGKILLDEMFRQLDDTDIPETVRVIKGMGFSAQEQRDIFRKIDYNAGFSSENARALGSWARQLGIISDCHEKYNLISLLSDARTIKQASQIVEQFAAGSYPLTEKDSRSGLIWKIAGIGAKFLEPELHLELLGLFDIQTPALLRDYVHSYVSCLMKDRSVKDSVPIMASLCEAAVIREIPRIKEPEYYKDVQRFLPNEVAAYLNQHYSPKMRREADHFKFELEDGEALLIRLLDEADHGPWMKRGGTGLEEDGGGQLFSGLMNSLSGLFGKKKK